ncbi:MAG: hypothetical protein JW827_08265, partial [Spirochaetes bacterium]|nr:hypothetical protein [Spirochaetota bacterium]
SRNNQMTIEYGYARDKIIKQVNLKIFDIAGNIIYKESRVSLQKGKIIWDIINQDNVKVAPGLYIFKLDIIYTDEEKDDLKFNKIVIKK